MNTKTARNSSEQPSAKPMPRRCRVTAMAEDAQGQTPKHQTDQSLVAAAAENIPACVKSLRNAQTQKYTTSPAKQAHDTNTTPSKAKDGAYTQTPEPQNNNETLVLLRHLTQTIPELNARIKNLEETTNHLTEAVRKHNTAQNQPQPPIIPEASKTLDLNGVMRMLDCKTKASVYRRLKVLKVRAFARGKYRWHAVYNAMRSAEEKRM